MYLTFLQNSVRLMVSLHAHHHHKLLQLKINTRKYLIAKQHLIIFFLSDSYAIPFQPTPLIIFSRCLIFISIFIIDTGTFRTHTILSAVIQLIFICPCFIVSCICHIGCYFVKRILCNFRCISFKGNIL